jgi:hypothetical protein
VGRKFREVFEKICPAGNAVSPPHMLKRKRSEIKDLSGVGSLCFEEVLR